MGAQTTDRMRAWVEVDLEALRRNAERIAAHVAPARVIPMVKADGYGLGAVPVARALAATDRYAFGVATVDEGVVLRRAGIDGRIIVFAACARTDAEGLREHSLEASVIGRDGLQDLARAGVVLHLELDTGMGRAGLDSGRVDAWAGDLRAALGSGARVASIFTHFHSASSDEGASREQLARFEAAIASLDLPADVEFARHVANSDAIRSDEQYHLDLVRPGLYLYGGGRGGQSPTALAEPEPVASIRARVLEVRDLTPGSTVSYRATYVTTGDTRLATLGIGYADGLPWRTSNRGEVLIGGRTAPFRGRVCMDVTAVDVSDLSGVETGDVATLLGGDGDERLELRDLAERSDTIEYEVLTGLGQRLPRVYTGSDGPRQNHDR